MSDVKTDGSTAVRPRVLVVDDDVSLRTVIAEALTNVGWDVRSAADGIDGLVVLRVWRPDIILLDLLMSPMDGRAFRAEMRRGEATSNIPIVLTTAGAAAEREAAALEVAGALAKPFEVDELVRCLSDILRR